MAEDDTKPAEKTGRVWEKALEPDALAEGRVQAVTCRNQTVCMTHFKGRFAALDNACPHQGGPLGEGSIEEGLLRCPWHGWDFDPLTGKAPGFDDGVATFPVEIREDGVYVGFDEAETHTTTVSDVMVETMVNWGVRHVWGMVGPLESGAGGRRAAPDRRRVASPTTESVTKVRHRSRHRPTASSRVGRQPACRSLDPARQTC